MAPLAILFSLFGGLGGLAALFGSSSGAITTPDNNRPDDTDAQDDHSDMGDDTTGMGDHTDHTGNDDDTTGMDDHTDHTGSDDDTTGTDDHTDHTGSDDDTTGTDDHTDHSDDMPTIMPPGADATAAEIEAYVISVLTQAETQTHSHDSELLGEHTAAMDLVPRDETTHMAIKDGDWFDPTTWYNGQIPGDDAKVLIPEGITVDYGGTSDARIFTIRVDGTLDFETDVDSTLIFDTFVVSPTGSLVIGTEENPVDPSVDIDLIVANNGPIDTDWDPMLLSRGLISHGSTSIHGAEKDSHEKVDEDPVAGETSISFASVPTGWQVGDTIVIAGTNFEGHRYSGETGEREFTPTEDEVRVITQIDEDGTIHFEEPLLHDHIAPRDDLKVSVANYTRNVSVETENADTAEVFERGHVMFMHSDDVEVRYAEFHELGRTDKSQDSDDVSNFDTISYDSNVQGRYSLHLHRTGTSEQDDPAIVEGNAVYGSPGWGYVHHDSHAILQNNASFDTFGAGYVAETGNETGAWIDNIAIFATGIDTTKPKSTVTVDEDTFDTGRGGDGFWFQGRMVASVDNVAASVNTGYVYFHRDGDNRMIDFDADLFDYSAALYYDEYVSADDVPILSFQGNEAFATFTGLSIVKGSPNQGHDVWSQLDDFTAWHVKNGAHVEYTSHYILTNFDVVGKETVGLNEAYIGISFGENTSEIIVIDAQVDGFKMGFDMLKFFNRDDWTADQHNYIIIDPQVTNAEIDFAQYDPALDQVINSGDLPYLDPNITIDGPLTFEPNATGLWTVEITGTKADSVGTANFPGGTDSFSISYSEVITALETKGYWSTSDGETYFLVDIYFTDRLTGEIYYETHPVFLNDDTAARLGVEWWDFRDAVDNGVQDFTTESGVTYAGSAVLDTAIPAVPTNSTATATAEVMTHSHATLSTADDSMDTIAVDGGLYVNTTTLEDVNVEVSDGAMVLATGGAEYDVGASKTLAVFAAAAKVGFDGDDGGMAILDMHEGATLAFAADDGGLGTIEEFSSGAFGDAPNVLSGIDLGNATLEIDLSGLDAAAGTQFTLMDSDELVGVFDDAIVGGLGARDATIVIDYETDSVTLKLTEGSGGVSIETLGAEDNVDAGEEDLWAALTADQAILSETDTALVDEEDDNLVIAA